MFTSTYNARSKPNLAPLFDGPMVRRIRVSEGPFAPCQPIVVDRYGLMMVEVTEFLRFKRKKGRSAESLDHWARVLADLFFVLDNAGANEGIPWHSINDDVLERLRSHFITEKFSNGHPTGHRGVSPKTWNERLTLLLEFLLYCEARGWACGLVGVCVEAHSFQVNLESSKPAIRHRLHLPINKPEEVTIPDDVAFKHVEAACERLRQSGVIVIRDRLIFRVLDRGLRRKEVSNLVCSSIPSTESLQARRAAAKATGVLKPVSVQIISAKTSLRRSVLFPLRLVELLREYIDDVRPLLVPRLGEDAVFISSTSGKRLCPQSITNLVQSGRALAAADAMSSGGDQGAIDEILAVHPHLYRHRNITDSLVMGIEAGLDPLHVLLDTMKNVGIASFATMSGYSHVAETRRRSVLQKQNKINILEEDEILRRLGSLRVAELVTGAKSGRLRARYGS